MSKWVQLCRLQEAPKEGLVMEAETEGVTVCLANIEGRLAALGNRCPHRDAPLGSGWVEGGTVVCPWHSWSFDTITGVAEPPEKGHVPVYPVRIDGDVVMVDLAEP